MRTILIGDLHGCLREWEKLLAACAFREEEDRLVLLGDLMNKGRDSFGDRIVVCNSYASGKPDNVLSVYDWDGNLITVIELSVGSIEPENISVIGDGIYITCAGGGGAQIYKVTPYAG